MTRSGGGSIFRNFGLLSAGKLAGDLFTFALLVAVSRVYGEEGAGSYSFGMGLAAFFFAIADFGLSNLALKVIGRGGGDAARYFGRMLTLRLLMCAVALLALTAVLPFLPVSGADRAIAWLIGLYTVLYLVIDFLAVRHLAEHRGHVPAVVEMSLRATIAVCALLWIAAGADLVRVVAVMPALTLVHVIVFWMRVGREFGKFRLRFRAEEAGRDLRDARPYALFIGLHQLSTRTDIVVLGLVAGLASAGIYNAAYRLVFMTMMLAYFAEVSVLPAASRLHAAAKGEASALYHRTLNVILLLAVPASVGMAVIAPELIALVFGERFRESATVLRLLSILVVGVFLKNVTGAFLTAADRQGVRAGGQLVAACLNVAGTLALVPAFGTMGAAAATVVSESMTVVFFVSRLRDLHGWPRIGSRLGISVLASAAFAVPLLRYGPLPIFASVPIAVAIYFGVVSLFPAIRRDEMRSLIDSWSTRGRADDRPDPD